MAISDYIKGWLFLKKVINCIPMIKGGWVSQVIWSGQPCVDFYLWSQERGAITLSMHYPTLHWWSYSRHRPWNKGCWKRFCKILYFHLFLITLIFHSVLDVSQMISGITVIWCEEVSLYKRKQVLFITLCAGPFKA